MVVLIACIAGNLALRRWALIFGRLGAPALGVEGSGYARYDQSVVDAGRSGVLCIRTVPGLAGLHMLRGVLAMSRTGNEPHPSAARPADRRNQGMEAGVFLAASVLMGLLGQSALRGASARPQLREHRLSSVPLGLSQAATVRVALCRLSAGRERAARRTGFVALALGVGFMGVAAR